MGADLHNAGGARGERGIRVYDRKKTERWEPSRERRTQHSYWERPPQLPLSILERIFALYKSKERLILGILRKRMSLKSELWERSPN